MSITDIPTETPTVPANTDEDGYLNPEALAKFAGCEEEDLLIPELGGKVRVRGLTKAEQQDVMADSMEGDTPSIPKVELGMVSRGLVRPQMTNDLMTRLLELPSGVFDRITTTVTRLSGADPEALKAAEKRFRDGA
jgi:hypothetical protein